MNNYGWTATWNQRAIPSATCSAPIAPSRALRTSSVAPAIALSSICANVSPTLMMFRGVRISWDRNRRNKSRCFSLYALLNDNQRR